MEDRSPGNDALRAQLAVLEAKLHALETAQAERRRTLAKLLASATLAALLIPAGWIYGAKAAEALFIDPQGNVGINTSEPRSTLDVSGSLAAGKTALGVPDQADAEVLSLWNSNSSRLAERGAYLSYWLGGPAPAPAVEIGRIRAANKDTGANSYLSFFARSNNTLVEKLRITDGQVQVKGPGGLSVPSGGIVAGGLILAPRIQLSEQISTEKLDVNDLLAASAGEVRVSGRLRVDGGVKIQPGALPRTELPIRFQVTRGKQSSVTLPVDPYCTDDDGCRIRIRAETGMTKVDFFLVTLDVVVSSGDPNGPDNLNRQIYMIDRFGEARCQVNKACGREWLGNNLKVNVKVVNGKPALVFEVHPQMLATFTVSDN